MKRNKVIEILLSITKSVGKIKDKRIRYAVLALIGLAIAASTQLVSLEGDIGKIEPSKSVIEEVVKEQAESATESIVEEILKNL